MVSFLRAPRNLTEMSLHLEYVEKVRTWVLEIEHTL